MQSSMMHLSDDGEVALVNVYCVILYPDQVAAIQNTARRRKTLVNQTHVEKIPSATGENTL